MLKYAAAFACILVATTFLGASALGGQRRAMSSQVPPLAIAPPGIAVPTPGGTDAEAGRMINLGPPDSVINFGRLDPGTGQIVDGTYLLYVQLSLGNAPLAQARVPLWDPVNPDNLLFVTATKANPNVTALATISDGDGMPGGVGFGLPDSEFSAAPAASVGKQGRVTLKLALIDTVGQDLKTAPGITAKIDARILGTQRPNLLYAQYALVRRGGGR